MLVREDWNQEVKDALNDLMSLYGMNGKYYSKSNYVVFDFDNSTSIFDVAEQLAIYQIQTMAFAFDDTQIKDVLLAGLDRNDPIYTPWIEDIDHAYHYLYHHYGPFQASGLDYEMQKIIQQDPYWVEFAVKMGCFYGVIAGKESNMIAYPWICYWFTGMSHEQVYELACRSHAFYSTIPTHKEIMVTDPTIPSLVGVKQIEWTYGISVSENIKELWKELNKAGIKIWVVSASQIDLIRGAIDIFGLHDYLEGAIGMMPQMVNHQYIPRYDYTSPFDFYALPNNEWKVGKGIANALIQEEGKATAINNILVKKYGKGPIAGFMDSTGDYQFCTEFASLKLVVCFNRANRSVQDGGGLISELAIYQSTILHYNLEKANESGDTYYVLQGRDENGLRGLRASPASLPYGMNQEVLFKNKQNELQLQYMTNHHLTTKQIIETFVLECKQTDSNNLLGFDYGFEKEYKGYHYYGKEEL